MKAYLGGQDVTLTIPLIDSDGTAISANAVSYRVIDQAEAELVAKVVLSGYTAGDVEAVVTVSGANNTIPVGESRALRVVELYVTTDVGTIKLDEAYFIEADEVLVEGINSFQNYNAAIYLAYEIPKIEGWSEASKSERIAAMIAARRNIGHLRFRYVFDANQNIIDNTVGVADLTMATVTDWLALPKEFRDAVCRAQILEANALLGGDEYGDLRRAGLMSMTVGEAKQFFRPAKAVERPVCNRAIKELAKYLNTSVRLTRV